MSNNRRERMNFLNPQIQVRTERTYSKALRCKRTRSCRNKKPNRLITSFLRAIVKRINETWGDSPFQIPIGVQVSDPKE